MAKARSRQHVFDAAAYLTLVDIALWESSLKRYLDYAPAVHDDHISVYFRDGVRAELADAEAPDGSALRFLRAFVTLGTRGVYSPKGAEEPTESQTDETDNVLFEIDATFLVVYSIKKEPSPEDLRDFVRLNCMHNAWPFWRQHVFDALKRGSLPQIALPFFQMADTEDDRTN